VLENTHPPKPKRKPNIPHHKNTTATKKKPPQHDIINHTTPDKKNPDLPTHYIGLATPASSIHQSSPFIPFYEKHKATEATMSPKCLFFSMKNSYKIIVLTLGYPERCHNQYFKFICVFTGGGWGGFEFEFEFCRQ
jgi:hypothetical protein